ncbi:TIGR04086 family membrane protein [Clostridium sp. MCC353]|uniref:TIGR04086 family membrane protein n=1 Tax=Clostridium sp. MCC353 TaxID=2592646 RepID=UPI001C0211B7|nr:TIGR04086 family membrane protein [Clostridium sp. MCC353]MBT9776391.1 TIGR04086 family membrane protein [Clostridium sp. MCC353]
MANSKMKVVLRSLLFSYLLTGILLVVSAFALYKLRLKESQVVIAVNAIYIITCLFGGFLMGKGIRQRRFFWGFILGALYFLVLFLVSMVMGKGLNGNITQIGTTLAICALSGTVGGMMS